MQRKYQPTLEQTNRSLGDTKRSAKLLWIRLFILGISAVDGAQEYSVHTHGGAVVRFEVIFPEASEATNTHEAPSRRADTHPIPSRVPEQRRSEAKLSRKGKSR